MKGGVFRGNVKFDVKFDVKFRNLESLTNKSSSEVFADEKT